MICRGRKGKYQLYDHYLAKGGEGSVYEIINCKGSVAKIYHDSKLKTSSRILEKKLKTMTLNIGISPVVNNFLKVAWPQDVLYDDRGGKFIGFVMPKLQTNYKIYHIQQDENHRKKLFPNYTWKYAVQYAYNLAWNVAYLHMNDIVIGDLNMNNIAIDTKGHVVLIDCDSFDITNKATGEHFKCEVGMPELLAPEIQSHSRIADANFTKAADDFSLAIHIFRLLMMNADPFCAKLVGKNVDSVSALDANTSILNGESPFFRKLPNKMIPPWAPPMDLLSNDIAEAFRNTFYYKPTTVIQSIAKRTTAEKWTELLFKYAKAEPNPNLRTCPVGHVYSAHRTSCPFCTMNKKN